MKITNSNSEYEKLLKIIDEDLLEFLKKNNALKKFIKNLRPNRLQQKKIIYDMSFEFTWEDSPEHHDFWSNLSKKYEFEKKYE